MSSERKIYPITDEILEAGERVFWETFEKKMAKLKAKKEEDEKREDTKDINKSR